MVEVRAGIRAADLETDRARGRVCPRRAGDQSHLRSRAAKSVVVERAADAAAPRERARLDADIRSDREVRAEIRVAGSLREVRRRVRNAAAGHSEVSAIRDGCVAEIRETRAAGLGERAGVSENGFPAERAPSESRIASHGERAAVDELGRVESFDARAAPRPRAVVDEHARCAARRTGHAFGVRTGNDERATNGNCRVRAEAVRGQCAAEPVKIRDETIRAAERTVREVVIVDADRRAQLPRSAALIQRVDDDVGFLIQRAGGHQHAGRGDVRCHEFHRHAAHAQVIASRTVDVAVEAKRSAVEVHKRTRIQIEQSGVRAGASGECE